MKQVISVFLFTFIYINAANAQKVNSWVGNYKIKQEGIQYSIVVKEENKVLNSVITAKGTAGYYNKYACTCNVKENWYRANEDWLNCYIVKLLDGRNVFNPKAGEFLFSIISTNNSYYPFFRGSAPPTKFGKTAAKFSKT